MRPFCVIGPSLLLALFSLVPHVPAAELDYPLSIAVTSQKKIYLADRNLPGIWKIEDGKLAVFHTASRKFRTPLNAIRCVAVDQDGNLLAGDSATRDVYRFTADGKPLGLTSPAAVSSSDREESRPEPTETAEKNAAEKGAAQDDSKKDQTPETSSPPPNEADRAGTPKFVFGQIGIPMDIAVDKSGDLLVSDLEIHRIVKIAKAESTVTEFAKVPAPRGLCFDADQNLWVISGRKLVKISPTGEQTTIVEEGIFSFPHTVAVTKDGTAFVCDGYEKCIWKIPSGGKPEKLAGGDPFQNPVGMRLVDETLYVVDPRAKAVFQVGLDGKVTPLPLGQ